MANVLARRRDEDPVRATFGTLAEMVNFLKLGIKRRVKNGETPFVTLWPVAKDEDVVLAHSPIASTLARAARLNGDSKRDCERRIDRLPTNPPHRERQTLFISSQSRPVL